MNTATTSVLHEWQHVKFSRLRSALCLNWTWWPDTWYLVPGLIIQGNHHHNCSTAVPHALLGNPNVQVRELDKFAGGMAAKKKACLDQIDKDRRELAHVTTQLENEGRK